MLELKKTSKISVCHTELAKVHLINSFNSSCIEFSMCEIPTFPLVSLTQSMSPFPFGRATFTRPYSLRPAVG